MCFISAVLCLYVSCTVLESRSRDFLKEARAENGTGAGKLIYREPEPLNQFRGNRSR